MRYRTVGNSDLRVGTISLGNWNTFGVKVDRKGSAEIVQAAIEAGVNLFDTADGYAAGDGERFLGEAIAASGRRADAVLATKCFFPMSDDPADRGLSRRHLFRSIERSLRNLRTDYVDLFQCHRYDPDTPLPETVQAMGDLVREGKILHWGVSRWTAEQVAEAIRLADAAGTARPISNQFFYNLLDRQIERDVLPGCEELGVGILAYSPLAQGVLTGKYLGRKIPAGSRASDPGLREGMWRLDEEASRRVARLARIAERAELPLRHVALAWALRRPGVASAIVGASTPAQITDSAAAAEIELGASVLAELDG